MKAGIFKGFSNEELVVMYRESKDEMVLQELISKNTGLLNLIANSYVSSIPHSELEDLVSESYLAMLDAIKDFDVDKGFNFSTLLKTYVRQRLNKIYYTETRKKRFTGSIPCSYEGLVEINKDGDTSSSFTVECEDIGSVEFDNLLSSMDFNEKEQIVVNILMSGGSKGDVAKYLSIAPASVTYYIRRIAKKFELSGAYCLN